MNIGFSGTQDGMTGAQVKALREVLDRLEISEARHGVCVGADAQFHYIVEEISLLIPIHGHPGPDGPKRAKGLRFETFAKEKPFLKRNNDIVERSECLVICPKGMNEELRSGTWTTFRYALKCRKLTICIYPNGKHRVFF